MLFGIIKHLLTDYVDASVLIISNYCLGVSGNYKFVIILTPVTGIILTGHNNIVKAMIQTSDIIPKVRIHRGTSLS